jgi:hypothetical protein
MEKSRDLLSHLAAELDRAPEAFLNRVNENLAKKEPDYPPIPHLVDGEPRFGVSLVLAFEYPHVFVNAVNESFSKFPLHLPPGDGPPGSNGAYITDQMHFTLLNVGIDCPGPEADRLVTAVKPPLSRLICTDFAVGSAVRVMCDQATVRPIFRIMPDGSIILLGSGAEFLRAFCDFRQSVLPVIERLTSGSEAYNIWMHTVYARPPKELTASQIEIIAKAAESLENEGRERIKLENARFAIMKFKDKKAILPPDALHAYNLAGHEWVES